MTINGMKVTTCFLLLGSYRCVDYTTKGKKNLTKLLKMKEFGIDPRAFFVRHSYLQHAIGDCKEQHSPLYHTFIVPGSVDLNDIVLLACSKPLETKFDGATLTPNVPSNLDFVDGRRKKVTVVRRASSQRYE